MAECATTGVRCLLEEGDPDLALILQQVAVSAWVAARDSSHAPVLLDEVEMALGALDEFSGAHAPRRFLSEVADYLEDLLPGLELEASERPGSDRSASQDDGGSR